MIVMHTDRTPPPPDPPADKPRGRRVRRDGEGGWLEVESDSLSGECPRKDSRRVRRDG